MNYDEDGVIRVPTLRTKWSYDRNRASIESGLECKDVTRTQQQFGEECDINTIVSRFGLTGHVPIDQRMPMNGDFTGVTDYQSALNQLMEAQRAFYDLPSDARKFFQNDPHKFLQFAEDPANIGKLREWGMAKEEVPQPVAPVQDQSST